MNISKTKLCLALLVGVVFSLSLGALPSEEPVVGVHVGEKAPDFTLPQLNGDPINLYEQVAHYDVTLLYFFYAAS